jgi:hypothetical protein
MRVLECMCGGLLRAEVDEDLFVRVYEHVARYHPELRFGKERLRTIVVNVAYYEENAPRCSFVADSQINREGFEADPSVTGFGFAVGKNAAA